MKRVEVYRAMLEAAPVSAAHRDIVGATVARVIAVVMRGVGELVSDPDGDEATRLLVLILRGFVADLERGMQS